jgi:hypothetical protein
MLNLGLILFEFIYLYIYMIIIIFFIIRFLVIVEKNKRINHNLSELFGI